MGDESTRRPEDGGPDPALVRTIGDRLGAVRERIASLGGPGVRIVAVTKSHPVGVARAALAAGVEDLGENYGAELVAKAEALGSGPRWHMIGGLQSRRVRELAGYVSWWHSLDRAKVVAEVALRSPGGRVLIQRNLSGDPGRSGCSPTEVEGLVAQARAAGLEVVGLMGVASVGPPARVEEEFRSLVAQADSLGLAEKSIGMSHDYPVAVACGATVVRLGTVLFGQRGRLSS